MTDKIKYRLDLRVGDGEWRTGGWQYRDLNRVTREAQEARAAGLDARIVELRTTATVITESKEG